MVDVASAVTSPMGIEDEQVRDIDREAAYNAPERISLVTKYILDHFNQKTYRNEKSYAHSVIANIHDVAKGREEQREKVRLTGFNSILATSSIDVAKLYYAVYCSSLNADVSPGVFSLRPMPSARLLLKR